MKKPETPNNEQERLKELLSYNVLDTSPEAEYDAITKLASSICNKPIALISLVDSDRQWFKSKEGLGADETPRDVSFCGHAINGTEIFEVKDSTKHPDFSDNPLVTGAPHVIFYAGAPLTTPAGLNVGTLCVIDDKPGELSEKQRTQLKELSKLVVALFEKRRKLLTIEEKQELLTKHQAQMTETAKMTSLGVFAGGIAHEINNPLFILKGNLHRIAKTHDIPAKTMDAMKVSLDRITTIVRSILRYSGENVKSDSSSSCELKDLIDEVLLVFHSKCESLGISVEKNLTASCEASVPGKIVFESMINLISNSIDALVQVEHERKLSIRANERDGHVELTIQDNGTGIEASELQRVFEPFYSGVKKSKLGTGLGLSTTKKIVEECGGAITIDSEHGKFTKVTLSLPTSKAAAA